MDYMDLLKSFRKLASEKEEKWALREVLGKLIEQETLDKANADGLTAKSDVDALRDGIYNRRNQIAHGRLGKHEDALVPYSFSTDENGEIDRRWYSLMQQITLKALNNWVLIPNLSYQS